MPTRNGTDTFTARIALSDNRCLHLWRPLAPLARAREHLEPLRALAHRSITRDYHSSSALPHDQGAKTRLYASGAQGGVAAPLTQNRISPTSLLPSYTLVNGRLDLRNIGGSQVTAGLWVKNLFDAKYLAGGTELANTGIGYTADFLGAPRTYGFELRVDF